MIITILDTILYVLIYGSMIVFPALFCIHMQIAWENHIHSYYTTVQTNTRTTPQIHLHPQYKVIEPRKVSLPSPV